MKRLSLLIVATFICAMTISFNASAMDSSAGGDQPGIQDDVTGSSPQWLLNLQQSLATRWNSIPNRAAFIEWTSNVRKTAAYNALVVGIGVAGAAFILSAIWEAATTHCKENCEENTFCTMINSWNSGLRYTGQYVYKLICAYIPYLWQTAVEHITKRQNPKRNCQLVLDTKTFTMELGEGCEGCTKVCNYYDITPDTDVLSCQGYCPSKTT